MCSPRGRRTAGIGLALAMLLGLSSGCSVGMALSGDPAPDLEACHVGASEDDIETALGPPVTVETLPDGGRRCVYHYALGAAPSPERAILHGSLDVLTFGLWELVGTPYEAVQGEAYQMTVTYDARGTAREIRTTRLGE